MKGILVGGILWAVSTGPFQHSPTARPLQGAVVTDVEPGLAASRGGLRPGDRIVAVRVSEGAADRVPREWPIDDPLDLVMAEVEAGGYPVVVSCLRESNRLEPRLPAGDWGLDTRPVLPDVLGRGMGELSSSSRGPGREGAWWDEAAERLRAAGAGSSAAWLLGVRSAELAAAGRLEEARGEYRKALSFVSEETSDAVRILVGRASDDEERSEVAVAAWEEILQRRGGGLAEALALTELGKTAFLQRRSDEAERLHERALSIRERAVPNSPAVAESLQHLGFVSIERRALDRADELLSQSRAISLRLDPAGLVHASTLRGLGVVQAIRGNPDAAAVLWRETLAIQEALIPRSRATARTLSNLGIAAWQVRDLDRAEELFRTALATIEAIAPGSIEHAGYLNNLGLVHHMRYEYRKARDAYQRAADIFAGVSAESLELARALTNVALAYGLGGDPERALEVLERVLQIQEKRSPGSTDVAQTHHAIGLNHDRLGDVARAEESFRRALALRESLVPGGLSVAITARALAGVLRETGRNGEAEALLGHALSLFERLSPGSDEQARALYELATIDRLEGRKERARRRYQEAVRALESQTLHLGGSDESRAGFLERFGQLYKDYMGFLLEAGAKEEAFGVLERYRARALLLLLAERNLQLDAELPRELIEQRRDVNRAHDRALDSLRRMQSTDESAPRIAALRSELAELRGRREELAARIRAAAPRLSAFEDPRPLGLAEAEARLPEGTVVLSYAVTAGETYLFALAAGPRPDFQVFRLEVRAAELREDVERMGLLIRSPHGAPESWRALAETSHALHETLITPAEEILKSAARVLVIPDGPLHLLPFAALVTHDARESSRRPSYLVERFPLQTALSVSLYDELAARSTSARDASVVAFADPEYRSERAQGQFPALRHARAEGEAIRAAFGERARVHLGAAASEEAVKSLDRDVSYLHFASHAVAHERFPLDSYLALAAPDPSRSAENGLLQAWEIFEQLRFRARLVTLSACETALGREAGGDGLIGLSRAFQYAGARAVLASLWVVSDRSTAVLMAELYRHLAEDASPTEALRAAQLRLIEAPISRATPASPWASWWERLFPAERFDASHPYHWAAFVLLGNAH